ncbi:MAG: hypothetical protein SFT81_06025 [Candidatus Caenarcaniphilales bacterium]|nr:hypothetical protein [Candidatus Caenarcaniphilales bacterium]
MSIGNLGGSSGFPGRTDNRAAGGFNASTAAGAASKIQGKNLFRALNLPEGLISGPADVTGVIPSLGDATGISGQVGIVVQGDLYNRLQRVLNAINYLNSSPQGTEPNPNFSYISGRPPYGQDSPEGQRMQAEVFAQLRATIIAQLTRVAEQLKLANQGLQTSLKASDSQKQFQDGNITKFVQDAFKGGGTGGVGA